MTTESPMPADPFSAASTLSYPQMLEKMEELRRVAEEVRRKEMQQVIAEIRRQIKLYGLTPQDLGFDVPRTPEPDTSSEHSAEKPKDLRSEVKPKYKGPNGELWSGRGNTPAWLQKLLKLGANKDDFLIKHEDTSC